MLTGICRLLLSSNQFSTSILICTQCMYVGLPNSISLRFRYYIRHRKTTYKNLTPIFRGLFDGLSLTCDEHWSMPVKLKLAVHQTVHYSDGNCFATEKNKPKKHYTSPDSYQVTWWPGEKSTSNVVSESTTGKCYYRYSCVVLIARF